MKLLRCHVENFGILSDFDLTFTEGLNVLCRENGFGKSTLAAFLKAMFYGLPKTRAKASERTSSTAPNAAVVVREPAVQPKVIAGWNLKT